MTMHIGDIITTKGEWRNLLSEHKITDVYFHYEYDILMEDYYKARLVLKILYQLR